MQIEIDLKFQFQEPSPHQICFASTIPSTWTSAASSRASSRHPPSLPPYAQDSDSTMAMQKSRLPPQSKINFEPYFDSVQPQRPSVNPPIIFLVTTRSPTTSSLGPDQNHLLVRRKSTNIHILINSEYNHISKL